MVPSKRSARLVGLLYLLMLPAGLFSLMYVPGKLIVKNNAAETVNNILAHETLFRIDLAVGLVSSVIFLFVALALYRLLRDVNPWQAAVMVILVSISVAQSTAGQLISIGTLKLANGADFLGVIDKPQRDALALLFLNLSSAGSLLQEMFWGLWLFPLGGLVIRCGFLPRWIGFWLVINGAAYVVLSLTGLLTPQFASIVSKVCYPALFGELALTLWLLIAGAKQPPVATQTNSGLV